MHDQTITVRNLLRVLAAGFAAVILLLAASGLVAIRGARSVRETVAALVAEQSTATQLLREVEREQAALNAVFYKLTPASGLPDRRRLLAELDVADERIVRIFDGAVSPSRPVPEAEEELWRGLHTAALAFSAEARRLLSEASVSSYWSRDLFRRHEEVTTAIIRLTAAANQRTLASQAEIERQSRVLARDSILLLSAGLAASVICSIFTVRVAARIFGRMEWQASELSRVSWRLLETQETTARRFSHELHDELGQSLAAVKANLMAVDPRGDAERARVDDCRSLVDEAIRNVRELSQLLHPTILDDFGLDASIRWLAERFSQRTGIAVEYQSEFSGRLAGDSETHLFRIVQEALTNAARHSGATRMEIRMKTEGGRLRLSLSDNGRGMQPHAAKPSLGLTGMRARARGAGGDLVIESKSGEGVRIEAWVPAIFREEQA